MASNMENKNEQSQTPETGQNQPKEDQNVSNQGTAGNDLNDEENPNRGGYMGKPGSNYAAGTFSGAAYGLGLENDKYRGYYGTENPEAKFGSNYDKEYINNDYYLNRPENDYAGNYGGQGQQYGGGGNYGTAGNYGNRPGQYDENKYGNQAEGKHKGKGPRGYKRSDSRIQEDVCDRLSDDPYVDASDIDVKVENGNVILSGHVESRNAKRRAEDIAEAVSGVVNVENRLHLRQSQGKDQDQGVLENYAKAMTAVIGDVTVGPENNDVVNKES